MISDNIQAVLFKSSKSWRSWLLKNHDKKDFIWLALRKKNSKIKCIAYQEALDEALCFGWIDGIVKRYDDDTFMQRFTPRKPRSIWSLINKNKVAVLIKSGKMTKAGLVKIEEAKKNGQWEKAYGRDVPQTMPDDLEKALKKNPSAWKNFSSFAPSYQRQYIAWICFVKKEDARKRRIAKVVDYASKNLKPGML